MKKVIQHLWVLFVCFHVQSSMAEEPVAQDDYHVLIKSFLSSVAEKKYSDAVNSLMMTNSNLSSNPSYVIALATKFDNAVQNLGEFVGFEATKDIQVSTKVAYSIGFIYFEKQAIVVDFMFLKKGNKWVFQSFSFNTDIAGFVRSTAKANVSGSESNVSPPK